MSRVAIIITVHNRKEKTKLCLQSIFENASNEYCTFDVFLTDDGSTDGTAAEISILYPLVRIIQGNGRLFWGGGMNLAWQFASLDNYDGYLWLNNDVILSPNIWKELNIAHNYSISKYQREGIYVGSTIDSDGHAITYGGWKYKSSLNKFLDKKEILEPNGCFQECDMCNGNVTYISGSVFHQIGFFHSKIKHGADFYYTYYARKHNIPVLVLRNYMGVCNNDHNSHRDNLIKMNLVDRIKYLFAPTGLQFYTALAFQVRFFWYRVPYVFVSYWIKVLFPRVMR